MKQNKNLLKSLLLILLFLSGCSKIETDILEGVESKYSLKGSVWTWDDPEHTTKGMYKKASFTETTVTITYVSNYHMATFEAQFSDIFLRYTLDQDEITLYTMQYKYFGSGWIEKDKIVLDSHTLYKN